LRRFVDNDAYACNVAYDALRLAYDGNCGELSLAFDNGELGTNTFRASVPYGPLGVK